jgi:hypothetical protein
MLHTLSPTNIHHTVAKIKKQIALHVAMSLPSKPTLPTMLPQR